MNDWFPTFRRSLALLQPWRANWAQQQSLLRLILVATEENLALSPLISAWAADESGNQRYRLYRLADLLRSGTPLPDAVEEVHDVLSDEDILAIRFGSQSGALAASMRARLDEPSPASAGISPRLRKLLYYVCMVVFIGLIIVTFLQIKIVPEFNKIIQEFSIPTPEPLKWTTAFAYFAVNYWYFFIFAIIGLFWLAFLPWPGRSMRRAVLSRLFRPLRELYTADVLEKLGVAIQAGRPLAGAVSTLARYHFDPTLRHQLLFIRNEMEQGSDVWQSMATIGLLNSPEVRVLETAGRVGNRPWALKQIALVKKRRTMQRFARWAELVLPAVVLLLGGFVLFQALGVFGPLVNIIHSLL